VARPEGRVAPRDREARKRNAKKPCSANWSGSKRPIKAIAEERARVNAYEQLAAEQIDPTSETIIQIAPGPRLGEKVLQFQGVCKGFSTVTAGEPLTLLEDCSFNVPRGAGS